VCNGRQPGTQLVELTVDKSSARVAVTRGPECRKLQNLHYESRCLGTPVESRLEEGLADSVVICGFWIAAVVL
jgi:hypothetical protein